MGNLLSRIMGGDLPQHGHNNPPSDAEILQERLRENNVDLLKAVENIVEGVKEVPASIDTDEQAGELSDTVKAISATEKRLEAVRVNEKEPYLQLGRLVDGYFKTEGNKLIIAKATVKKPLEEYLLRKADEERKRRAEEAVRLAEAAKAKELAAAELAKSEHTQKIADIAMVDAAVTEQHAAHVAQSALAKPAELVSMRGVEGSLSGLRTRWVGELTSKENIDLDKLRPFFTDEAIQKAINGYVAAGGRDLKGARIYEKTSLTSR